MVAVGVLGVATIDCGKKLAPAGPSVEGPCPAVRDGLSETVMD
jgi:hypothetical protein